MERYARRGFSDSAVVFSAWFRRHLWPGPGVFKTETFLSAAGAYRFYIFNNRRGNRAHRHTIDSGVIRDVYMARHTGFYKGKGLIRQVSRPRHNYEHRTEGSNKHSCLNRRDTHKGPASAFYQLWRDSVDL